MRTERTLGVYKSYLREDVIGVLRGEKLFHEIEHLTNARGRGTSFCMIPYRLFDYINDDQKSINAVLMMGYIMSTSNETFNLTNFFNTKLGKRLKTVSSTHKVRKEIANFGAPVLKELISFGKVGDRCIIAKVDKKLYEEKYSGIDNFAECEELHDETTEELSVYTSPEKNVGKARKEKAKEAMNSLEINEHDFSIINRFKKRNHKVFLSPEFLKSFGENISSLNNFTIKGDHAHVKNKNILPFIETVVNLKRDVGMRSFESSNEMLEILEKKY